jgi:hypothetical protein
LRCQTDERRKLLATAESFRLTVQEQQQENGDSLGQIPLVMSSPSPTSILLIYNRRKVVKGVKIILPLKLFTVFQSKFLYENGICRQSGCGDGWK